MTIATIIDCIGVSTFISFLMTSAGIVYVHKEVQKLRKELKKNNEKVSM